MSSKARKAKPRDLAAWDAEIEADFQRAVEATRRPRQRHRRRHIGCPWEFLVDVCQRTRRRAAMALALYIYRRTEVCRDPTVKLLGPELAELGINRRRWHEALRKLQAVGLVQLHKSPPGQKTEVTLLWRPSAGEDTPIR
jgi:hypothetical protein